MPESREKLTNMSKSSVFIKLDKSSEVIVKITVFSKKFSKLVVNENDQFPEHKNNRKPFAHS